MSWIAAGGLALSVGSTVVKGVAGANQKAQAAKMAPVDPGYVMNQNVIDNAKMLSDKYNNYVMPGYETAKNDLNNSFGASLYSAQQGATSSADVLDAASRLNFNQNRAVNNLNATNAQMKENLLPQVLNASAAAGNEYVLKNKYDNDRFDQQVNAKAALNQAGNVNEFNALDGAARVGTAFLNYQSNTPNSTTAKATVNPSIFDSGMSTLNGYSAQKKKAANYGFGNYIDPNSYA